MDCDVYRNIGGYHATEARGLGTRGYLVVHVESGTGGRRGGGTGLQNAAALGAEVKRDVVMYGVSVSDRERVASGTQRTSPSSEVLWRVTARETTNTRATAALRRRFDALRATPLRAHPSLMDNAALSYVELSSYPPRVDIVLNPVSFYERYEKAQVYCTSYVSYSFDEYQD